MTKCMNCGTGWTSQGLLICPICGTKVEAPAAAPKPLDQDRHGLSKIELPVVGEGVGRKAANGSAVLDVPRDLSKAETRKLPAIKPPDPAPAAALPPVAKPEPFIFRKLDRVEPVAPPAPAPEPVAKVEAPLEAAKPEPYIFRHLRKSEVPPLIAPTPAPVALETRNPEPAPFAIDASAAFPAYRPPVAEKDLPVPARPMHGPLILGFLAYVGVLLLPLTLAFEGTRVLGVLGFTMSGFFAPFAPIAWMVGLSAEKRRREQGLRPERQVALGRLLGQWGTLILVGEMTLGLVAIAALRLSGKFPNTFWSYF